LVSLMDAVTAACDVVDEYSENTLVSLHWQHYIDVRRQHPFFHCRGTQEKSSLAISDLAKISTLATEFLSAHKTFFDSLPTWQ